MGTPVSVMNGTAELSTTDTLMTSVQVTGSAIVEDVTAKPAGMGKSVSIYVPAHCRLRRASRSVGEALTCLAPGGVNVNVVNAPATLQEIRGCMGRRVSVTTATVRTSTVSSVEVMAHAPVAAACVRQAGLEGSASIHGSVT